MCIQSYFGVCLFTQVVRSVNGILEMCPITVVYLRNGTADRDTAGIKVSPDFFHGNPKININKLSIFSSPIMFVYVVKYFNSQITVTSNKCDSLNIFLPTLFKPKRVPFKYN